jgi:hypothetical protein
MPPPRVKAAEAKPPVQAEPAPPPVAVAPGEVPPPPALDKMQGIKTPAYVAWLKRYHPEEYKQKFGRES